MDKKKIRKPVKFDQIPVDEIIMMSDDDLRIRIDRLRVDIEKIRSRGDFALHLEVDYCYLQREYQVRESRNRAHQMYQQRMAEEDRQEFLREQTLPEYKPEPAPRRWF